jgi:hypothetical protein
MNPAQVVLPFPYVVQAHHPTLVVLDIALQAAISALYQAHPSLDHDHDHDSPPYDHNAPTDEILAQILVVSSFALLDLLRHYRAVQDLEADF